MITDMQLGVMANALGVAMLLLVVLFHYITANQHGKKKLGQFCCPSFIAQKNFMLENFGICIRNSQLPTGMKIFEKNLEVDHPVG